VATWTVEAEPEVERWVASLDGAGFAQVERAIDRLAREGVLLGEPYSRQIAGKLRELRVNVGNRATRMTYFVAPGGRIVLLTVFVKTQRRETAEIRKAERAMAACIAEGHSTDEEVQDDG
jgi:hypothetical protein